MITLFRFVVTAMLALTVPALAQAQPVHRDMPRAEVDAASLLAAFAAFVDLRIASVQRSLEMLAATSEVRSGSWQTMEALIHEYQKSDSGLVVWYAHPDGSYLTGDKGAVAQNLSDREYFPSLMAGREVMGALVVSRSTGLRSAVVAIPIEKEGAVVGAIGASLFLEHLSEQVSSALSLRPGLSFFAMAPSGLSTLHSRADRHFLDPREQGSETLRKAANEMLATESGRVTYVFDNVAKTTYYRTSPLTGWKFALVYSGGPIN